MADRLAVTFRPLGSADGWNGRFGRELNATEDKAALGAAGLPVIDGKHIEPFRTHAATAAAHISREAASRLMPHRRFEHPRLAYRDVSGYSNRQSLIAALVPPHVVTTHTLFCLRTDVAGDASHFLCAVLNSYVVNAIARMLMGSHLTTSLVEHLPVPLFSRDRRQRRIARLARRLGTRASPVIEARLQADVAHVYGLERSEFVAVLEGFPLVPTDERQRALTLFDDERGR